MLTVFTQAQELRKAMVAHERAIAWQELFELATHVKLDTDAIVEIAYRVAGASLRFTYVTALTPPVPLH